MKPFILHKKAKSGFTLIEMLMCMTMLALIMLPFALAMGSSSQASRQAYLQSTRTILLNSLKNEARPTDPSFVTNFTDGSMQTGVTDSGTTIGYRRAVDATTSGATNAIKRTALYYLYTNTTDASSSPRYKTTVVYYPKVFRMHFGNATDVIDTLNRYWYSDNNGDILYSGSNKVPGWASVKANQTIASDILNTTGNDDQIYQSETYFGSGSYSMDVDNGPYTVKVLWCASGVKIIAA